jgi:two-component system, LuxR family, response regulator FixJ
VELVGFGHMGSGAPVSPDRDPIIYIVEDDEAVRDALAVLLESAGYAVGAFASARAFLDAYQPGRFGCLLVDLDLPEMDGPELLGILIARRIELPAVLMSGRMRKLRPRNQLPPGAVGLLEKPFGDHELLQRIAFALGLAPPTQ